MTAPAYRAAAPRSSPPRQKLAGVKSSPAPPRQGECYPEPVSESSATAAPETPLPLTSSSARFAFGTGFYEEEVELEERFRWMGLQGTIELVPGDRPRFLELEILSEFYDLSQALTVTVGRDVTTFDLGNRWNRISLPVPVDTARVKLEVSRPYPREYYPGDQRELAVRVRRLGLHGDTARHRAICGQHDNDIANLKEMLAGKTTLESTPPVLGIDLIGRCNVNPPCVFCEWAAMKEMEGENATLPFNVDTLHRMGDLFAHARLLVNCSIGEPFLMANLDEILDALAAAGKTLEMSTNGQILTERNIERLFGREVHLYVSVDAATPETYAKLRNDAFNRVVANVRRLVRAKGGRGAWPKVYMVFMPMAANVDELPAFVRLCAELEVDQLVLRPLNPETTGGRVKWERGGAVFDYRKQVLPFSELIRVAGRADELCRRLRVPLANQLDFGGNARDSLAQEYSRGQAEGTELATRLAPLPAAAAVVAGPEPPRDEPSLAEVVEREPAPAATCCVPASPAPPQSKLAARPAPLPSLGQERWPLCLEPWRNLYILRRGIMPCCYGGSPIAPMEGHREAWNGPLMRSIRGYLARGRFHEYCLHAHACPIVAKHVASRKLSPVVAAFLRARLVWARFNEATGGVPARLLQPVKWTAAVLWRLATQPRWVIHHTKRILHLGTAAPADHDEAEP
jgi:uncharacterized Fe-S cluster-containing radical SAM superfamily protein